METSIVIAGFGGQGVLLCGKILAKIFMLNNKNVTWYPCYGSEMRGGAVNCEIVVSDDEVTSVHKKQSDILLTLNDISFNKLSPNDFKLGLSTNRQLQENVCVWHDGLLTLRVSSFYRDTTCPRGRHYFSVSDRMVKCPPFNK